MSAPGWAALGLLAAGFVAQTGLAFYALWRWRKCIDKWAAAGYQVHELRQAILADGALNSRAWDKMGEQLRKVSA